MFLQYLLHGHAGPTFSDGITCKHVFFNTGSIDLEGLNAIKWDELFSLPKHYWEDDIRESKRFLELQVGEDLPKQIKDELKAQETRIEEELFA